MRNYSLICEGDLFDLIRKDDKQAFAEIFSRHWRKAYLTARSKVRDKQAAEEIVQELFILLWDKRESLSIHNFSSFLFTCIKNKCLNYIEAQLVRKKYADRYEVLMPKTAQPADHDLSLNELLDAINAGMQDLPNKTQKVFRLNRLEGQSISEIAKELNLSEKTIEYHLTRSLKQLRFHLKDFMILLFSASACLI